LSGWCSGRLFTEIGGLGVMLAVTAVLAIPLVLTLQAQPEAEGRVGELAVPLVAARQGNFAPLQQYVVITLSMFHATGDDEWLYNIPNRPLFNAVGAVFFWGGVLLAIVDVGWRFGSGCAAGVSQRPSAGHCPRPFCCSGGWQELLRRLSAYRPPAWDTPFWPSPPPIF
jgi:hypothetical protein